MSVHYRSIGSAIIIFGNTFPAREQIKALGGRFNGVDKNWRVPQSAENLERVAALCRAFGGGELGGSSPVAAPLGVAATGDGPSLAKAELTAEPGVLPVAVAKPDLAQMFESSPSPDASGMRLRELVERAAAAVEQIFPRSVWVFGEIQNLSRRPRGIYFDLAERSAQGHANATLTVRTLLWSDTLDGLLARHGAEVMRDVLADGMAVRMRVRVTMYRERGSLSLTVEDVDPSFTKGALALARERLLRELRAKGLDQWNKKRVLPVFPFRIALITAAGSRAESDFLDQLASGAFPGEVVSFPTPMQGEAVPRAVADALARATAASVDLIVITRGGGSAADLRWFDAPEVAYAIAHCPVPIVAAIGHHDDVPVAEEIACVRQKTPTAAAEFVLDLFTHAADRITRLADRFAQTLANRLEQVTLLQAALAERLAAAAIPGLAARAQRLSELGHRLGHTSSQRLVRDEQRLANARHALARTAEQRVATLDMSLAQRAAHLFAEIQASCARHDKRLAALAHTLSAESSQQVARCVMHLQSMDQKLRATSAQALLHQEHRLSVVDQNLGTEASRAMSRQDLRLAALDQGLAARDPRGWLARGWTQLSGPDGPLVRAAHLAPGTRLRARLVDAALNLVVESIEPRPERKTPT